MSKQITLHQTIADLKSGSVKLIDVREPMEFSANNLDGAINIPSSNGLNDYNVFNKTDKLVLVCQSGRRAGMVSEKLIENGFQNVYVLDQHMNSINTDSLKLNINKTSGWTVDRQFRMTLGVLLTIFIFGYFFIGKGFIAIPIILATGLVITSIIDRCYMRMGIAALPWNKGKTE